MSNVIALGCVVGLLVGLYHSFTSPPAGGHQTGTLNTYTTIFEGDVQADIKVCKGDPPFVDAILYDSGSEVELLEVTDVLLGEYVFYYDGQVYTVVVEEGYGDV